MMESCNSTLKVGREIQLSKGIYVVVSNAVKNFSLSSLLSFTQMRVVIARSSH